MSFFCLFLEMFPLGVEVSFSYRHENSVLFSSNYNKTFLNELLLFTNICLLELFVDKFFFYLLREAAVISTKMNDHCFVSNSYFP